MKRLACFSIVISVLWFANTAVAAQAGKEAYVALKRLEAKCHTGVSYSAYKEALSEAKLQANLFLESKEAKKDSRIPALVKEALMHYENAGPVFHKLLGGKFVWLEFKPSSSPDLDNVKRKEIVLINSLLDQYGARIPVSEGGAMDRDAATPPRPAVNLQALLDIMWNKASGSLSQLSKSF